MLPFHELNSDFIHLLRNLEKQISMKRVFLLTITVAMLLTVSGCSQGSSDPIPPENPDPAPPPGSLKASEGGEDSFDESSRNAVK